MTVRQMSRLLKSWIAEAGLDPKKYGIEFLRRTKALHILNGTGDLEAVRVLLGHTKLESTARYLHIAKRSDRLSRGSVPTSGLRAEPSFCLCCV